MKNIYHGSLTYLMLLTLIVVGSITCTSWAQESGKQILQLNNPENAGLDKAKNQFPVYAQPFTKEKKSLNGGESVSTANFRVFKQKFSGNTMEKLVLGVNLKSAKTSISSFPLAPSGKKLPEAGDVQLKSAMSIASVESPVGTPDHYAVPTDQVLSIAAPGFLANDIDLDGEALSAITLTGMPSNGHLTAFADGSFTYTPDAGFTGTDQFSYRMQNESFNQSGPVTVTIDVLPAANRNPIGISDNYAMLAGTVLSISSPGFLANDIDLDGETLSATSLTGTPSNGEVSAFADGSFQYTPDAGFTGTDQFGYRMQDASGHYSEPTTVTIEVYQGNRPPIGVGDQYAVVMNTSLTIAAPGFLANDIDLDGETLSAISLTGIPSNGGMSAFADGSFTYTPDAGFTGTDQFAYRMQDASGNYSDPVTVTIFVSGTGTTPLGMPDQYMIPTDQVLSIAAPGFLANDIDLDGEAISAVSITDWPDDGLLSAFADGRFTYTPNEGFTGTDQFSYEMRDASNNYSGPVTVTIDVLPSANRYPIGTPDHYAMLAGTVLSITSPGFLANDIDPDGEELTATLIADNADNGQLVAFADGSFTYTPNTGFSGTDHFEYLMRDASGNKSEPVPVTIEVYQGNRPPIGVSDQYAVIMNTPLIIAAPGFLANDIDLDGEVITATLIADNANNGLLVAFPDGNFTYTPNAGFTGTDQFSYLMRDASYNESEPITVTLEVYLLNEAPVADAGDDQPVECDGSELYTVFLDGSGSSDPDGDALTYTWRLNGDIVAGPSTEATAEIQLALGVYEIELTVQDIHGEIATDVVTITVEDTTPPTFTAPGDIVIAKTEDCTFDADISITGDVWDEYDLCGVSLEATFTDVIVPGACIGEEIITRTWSLTDDAGNTTTHVQVITAEDQMPPVLVVQDDYTICMDPMPDYLTATYTDNCSPAGETTATGTLYSETDCITVYAYVFNITDDCGNPASETVYVTRETEVFANCETAYARLEGSNVCFMEDRFKNWGWTNYIEPSETPYTMELYAGAGQCDISKGTQTGTVEVLYFNNEITVTYHLFEGYVMKEAHINIGCGKYPFQGKKETVSPGFYTYNAGKLEKTNQLSVTFNDVDGGVYLIAHATICEILCECAGTEYVSVSDERVLGIDCNALANNNLGATRKSAMVEMVKSSGLTVYPNPFSDKLNFEFTSPENGMATLEIYNTLGQKVRTLLDRQVRESEAITVTFTPETQVSGMYIYQLKLNGNVQVGKVIFAPER